MSRRDEAVEAWAAAVDAAYNPDRYPIMAAMFRDYADAGLDAALAVLQPATRLLFRHADLLGIDSAGAVDAGGGLMSTKALEALPVGTVIRIDTRAYVHTAAWEWVETVTGTAYTPDELDAEAIVIYQPKEES